MLIPLNGNDKCYRSPRTQAFVQFTLPALVFEMYRGRRKSSILLLQPLRNKKQPLYLNLYPRSFPEVLRTFRLVDSKGDHAHSKLCFVTHGNDKATLDRARSLRRHPNGDSLKNVFYQTRLDTFTA